MKRKKQHRVGRQHSRRHGGRAARPVFTYSRAHAETDFAILLKRFAYAATFAPAVEAAAQDRVDRYHAHRANYLTGREDLRAELVMTIDGVDARDHDDAISLTQYTERGKCFYKLGVHIADVAAFIQPQSRLDLAARQRGTAVYVPGHVLPMVPAVLANGICSLAEQAERLTFSGEFVLTQTGKLVRVRFFRSVVKSRYRLNYPQVDAVLAEKLSIEPELDRTLKTMAALSRCLRRRRRAQGALLLSTQEQVFTLQQGTERVTKLGLKSQGTSEQLIEEFMLLMNKEVARLFHDRGLGIFRVHPPPQPEALTTLFTRLSRHRFSQSAELMKKNANPMAAPRPVCSPLTRLLSSITDQEMRDTVSQWILMTMQQADYQAQAAGHYGLAFEHYTHFTSPIRRYPDLLAHRLLLYFLKLDASAKVSRQELAAIAAESSFAERKAVKCEREYKQLKSIRYLLALNPVMPMVAMITGFHRRGHVYVRVEQSGIEGRLAAEYVAEEFSVAFDEQQMRALKTEQVYGLGARLKVCWQRAEPERLLIDFKPAPPPWY